MEKVSRISSTKPQFGTSISGDLNLRKKIYGVDDTYAMIDSKITLEADKLLHRGLEKASLISEIMFKNF